MNDMIDNYVFESLTSDYYLLFLKHQNNYCFSTEGFFINLAINISQLLNIGSDK